MSKETQTHNQDHHEHFIVPDKYYILTFIALVLLTFFTVFTSRLDFGILNEPLALSIAVVKATLVAMFFMGLRWEKGINVILMFSGIIAIVIFFALTFADVAFRGDITLDERIPFEVKPLENEPLYPVDKYNNH